MHESKGFVLIELLVVIAIIALLMAVLMPALQRVRLQAKAVACQSSLHQWTIIFEIYVNGVFLDFSVRRIGLKELRTFKWHRSFDTNGTWTKAGGAGPDEWPE